MACINERAFHLTGAAFSPSALAPFEIEFHYARRRDLESTRTIIRFGFADGDANHRKTKLTNVATMLASRPKTNREWAVAVEMTPIES